ncbi:hypothetical protein [Spirosoma flavum]|uniref:T9SS type A sorting domain-containing protein n=1 Tax=Spirosoma flavum TaxID=2048557 RepID=A0ABW6AQ89_9BACT
MTINLHHQPNGRFFLLHPFRWLIYRLLSFIVVSLLLSTLTTAQINGPICDTYTNKTTANGLGDDLVRCVFVVGNTVYAGTNGGLGISIDGGNTFTNRTTTNGLGSNGVINVYVTGNTIYAATFEGLSISTDGGNTFINKTIANGLGDNPVLGVYALGNTVYAAAYGGLSISTDGGNTFINYTTANGLGDDYVTNVYATSSTVYAATAKGLSFCTVNPLPVTLTYFTGHMTGAGALLKWETSHEANSAFFRIERSRNAINFDTIGKVPSQAADGSSFSPHSYSFIDATPLSGTNYYRLVQIDQDSTQNPSRIIALSEGEVIPTLYPNPVPISGEVLFNPAVACEQYQLTDVQGRVVKQDLKPSILSSLSMIGLPAGVYRLTSKSTVKLFNYQIVVQP